MAARAGDAPVAAPAPPPAPAPASSALSLQAIARHVGLRWRNLAANVGRIYVRSSPFIKTVADYAWFVGSSALLLALPIVVELQRETTVLVLQRQREAEMAQMQEQARMMNASTIENLRQTASMMMGGGPPPPPGQQGGAR